MTLMIYSVLLLWSRVSSTNASASLSAGRVTRMHYQPSFPAWTNQPLRASGLSSAQTANMLGDTEVVERVSAATPARAEPFGKRKHSKHHATLPQTAQPDVLRHL
jgi:hypothetical protein